ncbi:outer membrane protein assembly factor BamC [Burkholderia glumae]|uniref:Outer membrane protein assembly factor BamC n=2 Tax=Burkholderia glumae TaxID=337 RepID=A0AAQ0BTW0_BURGL|nr:outer membrane protein assembly factor BamC [Burkholderia glumae]ACR29516.1 NlpBDapX family lipoprotei [Burkholderia glumae BGR1]AJY67888.1 nlpB/DapX lipofamily protein [Burkholderia glumae LMG 2196 = ATCC 33617]MCM2482820.1 outer membrane protein assembly factor BamC [Burkholderia glumae]MCM2490530.1 outer membrane protein assembly factor BamC [Burkholderia glumae]MCM2507038.1 outer membrane protein assembly factor BamC [Burkholderia glumae]
MKHFAFSSRAFQASVMALALGALAGCDTLNDYLAPDRVNYKATGSAPPLEVPKDLTAVPVNPSYVAPPTNAGLGSLPQRAVTAAGNATEGQPNAQDPLGMHVERDGDRRWLVVDGRTPEQLWPQLKEFWVDNGFALKTDAPQTGIMATDWAENRANIPDDWFRRTIGRVIDFAYSSGTRDSFRTLVTRGPDGSTDISITHSAMEEVLTGPQGGDSSRWVERPRNPVLEAVFLTKLMEKFGLTDAQAKQLLTDARPAAAPAKVVDTSSGAPTLDLAESFERAWLRVGLALDRTNFAVDNRDRAKGIYMVRYANSAEELKREGVFGKLFFGGPSAAKPGKEFFVSVRANGGAQTRVAVVDENGQIDNSADAQRIIKLLHAQLN